MNVPGNSDPLLRLTQVRKSFGAVQALKGISFELLPGEVHALVGENGAGKSTLVKIISGAIRQDAGTIEVGGEPIHHLTPAHARKLGVACIYQQPALFPDLSVTENLWLRLETPKGLRRIRWRECRARAHQLLERVGARIAAEVEVRQLSMPEQQLVEIACAIGSGAKVIIMDEPTASLTRKEQHLLFSVIRNLRQNGAGILYISHRLEEVLSLADRITVLRDGESLGTNRGAAMTEAALIRLMVGRDLAEPVAGTGHSGHQILSLRKVGCSAGGVRGVDLDLRAAEVVGLAGLVGAGRTELARVLFGITPADSGEILLHGQPVKIGSAREAIRHGIAYLPEDRRRYGIILEMSLAENISMAVHDRLFPAGWLRRQAERQLAVEYMRSLSIKAAGPDASGSALSGGNQQKVALARWLATKPKLLILDEPTQGVDIATQSDIHRMVRELADSGVAVLLISSDLPEVLALSDRIGVMRGGTLVACLPRNAGAREVMALALGREPIAA